MSISLKPNSVPADAKRGTVVGTLSDSRFLAASYSTFFSGNQNLFSVTGVDVLVSWVTPPAPGNYALRLLAFGYEFLEIDFGTVTVTVTPSASQIGIDLENVYTESQATPEKSGP